MRVRVTMPEDVDPRDVAQAMVGPFWLIKAERQPGDPTEPVLRELLDRIIKLYREEMRLLLDGIRAIGSKVEKASKPSKLILSSEQRAAIAKLIRDHHAVLSARVGATLPAETPEIDALIAGRQIDLEPLLEEAYRHGLLSAEHGAFRSLTELRKKIKSAPKLTELEVAAAAAARMSAGTYIQNIGQKVAHDFTAMSLNEEAELRRKYIATVRDETAGAIERREGWQRLASNLAHSTDDWERDMRRVAATELVHAHQEGFANTLIKREGTDVLVYRQPDAAACRHCTRLYLTSGPGSTPKIFRLQELLDNGTNVGKKANGWDPVVGATHPWCGCTLHHVPPGFRFEDEPEEDSGFERIGKKDAWEKDGKPWIPSLVFSSERNKSELRRDLQKSFMQYTNAPEKGCSVRVGDPTLREEIERVIAETPEQLFHRDVGVTLITTDHHRPLTGFAPDDLAYWTGNEIRISQTLPPEHVRKVLQHELGHSLNVYLMRKFGGDEPVYAWHDELDALSRDEGYVTEYAKRAPIENHAEVTRWFLFARDELKKRFPRQHDFLHAAYSGALEASPEREDLAS